LGLLIARRLAVIDQLISSVKPQIIAALGSQLGLSPQAADQFVGKALPMLQNFLTSGKVDPAALIAAVSGGGASGGIGSLLKGLDVGPLAAMVGGDASKAQAGVDAIAGPVLNQIKNAPNSQELIGQLLGGDGAGKGGGVGGLLGSLASGLLGGKK
jgi:hypothetical protein